MKKQFFYAALAIGMMSSCSSNDLPGNQAPEEQLPEEERVAIELGISSPNAKIEASTKGIGAVGGTTEEGNEWNGEELGIWMYKVTSANPWAEAVEDDGTTPVLDGVTKFKAPYGNEATSQGKIHMIYSEGATESDNKYIAKYYPSTGRYSFYGFHLDNATNTPNYAEHKIENIVIDGTQDIMAAVTKDVDNTSYTLPTGENAETFWSTAANQSFSAWSARRNIQPILNFEHKLARLRFFVKAGEASAAAKKWNNTSSQWEDIDPVSATKKDGSTEISASKAVTITSIKVKELNNKLNLVFSKDAENDNKDIATVTALDNVADFTLMGPDDADDDGNLDELTPQAPEYWSGLTEEEGKSTAENSVITGYKEKNLVGESMMFFPNGTSETSLSVEIGVQQAVVNTYTTSGSTETPIDYILKTDVLNTTLDANKLGNGVKFTAGKSYDIIITVYSYQRIEISAVLTEWASGGTINTAPGDDFNE